LQRRDRCVGIAVKRHQISEENLIAPTVNAQGVNADVQADVAIAKKRGANLEKWPAIEWQHLVRQGFANCFSVGNSPPLGFVRANLILELHKLALFLKFAVARLDGRSRAAYRGVPPIAALIKYRPLLAVVAAALNPLAVRLPSGEIIQQSATALLFGFAELPVPILAPPALRMPSKPTIASSDRSVQIPTKISGLTPSFCR